jgi:large subunit ribosomal protein L23
MNQEGLINLLVAPLVSEKTARAAEAGQYVFAVRPEATKPDIKKAVELMFKVQVDAVTVCNLPGKAKLFRGRRGRRNGLKKAYVKLKPGFNIEFGTNA